MEHHYTVVAYQLTDGWDTSQMGVAYSSCRPAIIITNMLQLTSGPMHGAGKPDDVMGSYVRAALASQLHDPGSVESLVGGPWRIHKQQRCGCGVLLSQHVTLCIVLHQDAMNG